jgi:Cu(I)/Ag(I) efflux system membrane fusion protein
MTEERHPTAEQGAGSSAESAHEQPETEPALSSTSNEPSAQRSAAPSAPPERPSELPPHHGHAPRRGFGPFALLVVAILSGAGAGTLGYRLGAKSATESSETGPTNYQCPMHPTVVQDHPGECPICGMKLVKVGGPATAPQERKIKFYRSPMDPKQTSPTPRKDEMGMDYVPVYEDELQNGASSVEGFATVDIDPSRQQLIGLKTVTVTRGPVSGAWRTFARIAVDERRVRHVNVKVPVFVENVYVSFVGQAVRRGETLFSGYSPELLAAQAEYRVALTTQKTLTASTDAVMENDIVTAARKKLQLLDLPEAAIKRLDAGGEAQRTITFASPIEGVVTKKDVVDGMKLEMGAMPYEIVDLSNVWVLADVYESDIDRVRVGMKAKLALKAYPNRTFEGTSTFIDPVLDPVSRTAKLRLEFANPTGELKPGMFGEATLESRTREGLRIPVDAVIASGTRNVVFVALADGKLQPREVVLGETDHQSVEVVSGLAEGEKVAVHANFLIDSESQLRASLAALADGKTASAPGATPSASASASASASPSPSAPTSSGTTPAKALPPAARPATSASGSTSPKGSTSVAPATIYSCPMHPEVTDTTASRCPKCGMKLEPHDLKGK